MPTDLCTICGTPLDQGACPNGHPQREARAARRGRRRKARKLVLVAIPLIALLAAGGYLALWWYPQQEAEDLMVPASAGFTASLPPLEAVVVAFPEAGDPEALTALSEVLAAADAARDALSTAQSGLEERTPTSLPLISDRPPLDLATSVWEQMADHYPNALQLVADLEAVARYIAELADILPSLDNLRAAVGRPQQTPSQVPTSVAAGGEAARQLRAELKALTPPDELTDVHAGLTALAKRILNSINQLERAGEAGAAALITATVRDILGQISSFREQVEAAPQEALGASLGDQIAAVERESQRITDGLVELEAEGVEGLTIPS